MKAEECTLFSGGAQGAEAEFGAAAEKAGMEEVNFTFEGHQDARQRGLRHLTQEELLHGDVSLSYVSKLMHRSYTQGPLLKKVLQCIWHQINSAEEVFVIGKILEDDTVKGGTGWGAEFAKLCNKPLHVFDQEQNNGSGGTETSGRKAIPKSRNGTSPAPAPVSSTTPANKP